ncbi:MAG: lamin tail domain-containing protein, partial [Actinomycetota bacterium]
MRKPVLAVLCLWLLALPIGDVDAAGTPGTVVISEIYGGGGNSEAIYANDYVELFNRTRSTIDVTNWTVGYSSATGSTWRSLTLRGTIPAYHYMLIRFGSAGGGGAALPVTPDMTASTNIARTAGKIRLTNPSGVVDLVGYGPNANAYEGRRAPAPPNNTQSITRQP